MALIDIILILIFLAFVIGGWYFGAIHTLGSIIGTFAGAFIAGLLYEPVGAWLTNYFANPNLMRICAFIFIFIIINRLIGFIFYLINKAFNILAIIPFLKTINRFIGIIFGIFEGLIVISLSLFVIIRFPLSEWFTGILQESVITPWFIKIAELLNWLLPEILKSLETVI